MKYAVATEESNVLLSYEPVPDPAALETELPIK